MWIRHLLLANRILRNEGDTVGGGGGSVFSEAQLTGIKSIVAGVVNQTIAARDKQSDKKRQDDAKSLQDSFAKLLDEKFLALKPAEEKTEEGGKPGKPGKDSVELATLRRQGEEMSRQLKEMSEKANAANARMRSANLRQTTSEQLATLGIEGSRFKGAFAVLQQEGRIRHRDDETDEMVFVDDSGSEVDLSVGLAGWAKSDDAKIYLPPSGTRGQGGSKGPGQLLPGAKPTREQTFGILGDALKNAISGE